MKTKIFFSGNTLPGGPLEQFCHANNWQLTAKSLIGFEPVSFEMPSSAEIIFFSSPRSVYYFFIQLNEPAERLYACVGSGTARELQERNITPVFIGEKSGDPESVGTAFRQFVGNRNVFFPVSSRSNETIVKYVPENQRTVAVCYRTTLIPEVVEDQQVYVFTSPSNVESFLEQNEFPDDSVIISWGKSTKKKLVETNNVSNFVLEVSSEEELIKILKNI